MYMGNSILGTSSCLIYDEKLSHLLTLNGPLIILTTYFTSKKDPQRNLYQPPDSLDYIKNWYESIISNKLLAVVFYDNLSDDFVSKIQNSHVKFIRCKLGHRSLNDERFLIYSEFLNLSKEFSFVLFTDINDVIILKNPLPLFISNFNKIFICRDNAFCWGSNPWCRKKISEFLELGIKKIEGGFLFSPVYNAGVIGGEYKLIKSFIDKVSEFLRLIPNSSNQNMLIVNLVLYKYYNGTFNLFKRFNFITATRFFKSIERGRLKFLMKKFPALLNNSDRWSWKSKWIFSGYPFTTKYKFYEFNNSNCYIQHK